MSLLRSIRGQLGLTQTQLGDAIGVDQRTIGRWELDIGEPTATHAAALIEYAGSRGMLINLRQLCRSTDAKSQDATEQAA
jgi:transcriptional regulator with XRE-family HTH domain